MLLAHCAMRTRTPLATALLAPGIDEPETCITRDVHIMVTLSMRLHAVVIEGCSGFHAGCTLFNQYQFFCDVECNERYTSFPVSDWLLRANLQTSRSYCAA